MEEVVVVVEEVLVMEVVGGDCDDGDDRAVVYERLVL